MHAENIRIADENLDPVKRSYKIILILLVGLFVSYRIIRQVDHDIIFDDEINFGLSVIAVSVFLWVLLKDIKEYIKDKTLSAFIPTVLGLFIVVGLLTAVFLLKERDKSASKIYCVSKIVDFNGVSIDFREDGTYKLTSWSLGADYYRGSYTMTDSIITLEKGANKNEIVSNRLLIRRDGAKDSMGNIEKSIYQIDKDGQIIKNAVDFRVVDHFKR